MTIVIPDTWVNVYTFNISIQESLADNYNRGGSQFLAVC